jgi:ABC-type nitrate/sulfonate/bicarbonate transport system substrate-binding protein
MKNKIFPVIALVFLTLTMVASACSTADTEAPEEPIKLVVNTLPYMSFVPLEIAEKEGYFTEQGLEVEFVNLGSDAEVVVALSQGDLDVSAGFVTVGMINAISQGDNIRFVADKGYIAPSGCTVNAFVARNSLVDEGGLDDLAQLEGRTIAMDPPTIEGYVFEKLVEDVGLSLTDIETNQQNWIHLKMLPST